MEASALVDLVACGFSRIVIYYTGLHGMVQQIEADTGISLPRSLPSVVKYTGERYDRSM